MAVYTWEIKLNQAIKRTSSYIRFNVKGRGNEVLLKNQSA
jgi:hypothetical protein